MTTSASDSFAPARPVVIYDGDCSFCRKQVQRIQRRAQPETFEFTPLQNAELIDRFPQLYGEDLEAALHVVTTDGQVHTADAAVYHIARLLPGYNRWTWLYHVPGMRPIFRAIYRWISDHRARLG